MLRETYTILCTTPYVFYVFKSHSIFSEFFLLLNRQMSLNINVDTDSMQREINPSMEISQFL